VISVVILTLNEAANLPRCLASVQWADDVVVVDSGSVDGTREIAEGAGARVLCRAFDTFAGQRNFAMESGQLRHPWCLHLDADEVVTPELRAEIEDLVRTEDRRYPVYRIASRIIFMGRWLRRAGMYPAYQVRLGRSDALRFVDYGHGQREVQAADQVGTLAAPLDHFNFSKGINDWLARHLRYARDEAREIARSLGQPVGWMELLATNASVRRRALKRVSYRLPWRGLLAFVYVYVIRRGFLDGRPGFVYARMVAHYHGFIALNLTEQQAGFGLEANKPPQS